MYHEVKRYGVGRGAFDWPSDPPNSAPCVLFFQCSRGPTPLARALASAKASAKLAEALRREGGRRWPTRYPRAGRGR